MTALVAFLAAAVAAGILTGRVRAYALRRSLLDIPNHRSSHAQPTPRGGGLAVAVVILGGTAVAALAGVVAPRLALAVLAGGGAVAAVGWMDDRSHVPARLRAGVHAAAALLATLALGGLPDLRAGEWTVPLGVAGVALAVLGIVWLTNLYNFMDGIDGIAGVEAVTVGLAGGGAALVAGERGLAAVAFLTAGAALGFLAWNWAPARIFMGDVGSGMLGFLFAVLALASERSGALPLLGWVILLGTFIADATITLVRRLLRGERWYDAHRSHAYQRAVQAGFGHSRVSAAALVLNLALAGLAWAGWRRPEFLFPAMGAAALLLAAAYLWVERRRPM